MEEKNEVLRSFKLFLKIIYEFVKTVVFIVFIFFIVRYLLIQPFIVEGDSMEPNFHNNEYLLVDKITYKFKSPQRGDVVILHPPNRSVFYIKRIIGLPGEKIVIENGKVYIYNKKYPTGIELQEPYLAFNKTAGNISQILQEDEYYVLGDNRENSSDSREFGVLPKSNIVGRVFITIFPFDEFGLVKKVQYPPEIISLNTREFDLSKTLLVYIHDFSAPSEKETLFKSLFTSSSVVCSKLV